MNENTKKWVQTAINALSTAESEMVRRANPRHRAYEVYNFTAPKLGLDDYIKDDFIL